MFDLRKVIRKTLVWPAVATVLCQPILVAWCLRSAVQRRVAESSASCAGGGKTVEPAGKNRPEERICGDAGPASEELELRLRRRREERDERDDSLREAYRASVSLVDWEQGLCPHRPAHPVSASEYCILLCRMQL
jgi:hypothetical protein